MAKSSVQGAFRRAKLEAGIRKREVSVHTLRHYLPFLTMSRDVGVLVRIAGRKLRIGPREGTANQAT